MENIVIDLLFVAILVINVVISIRKGFFKSLFALVCVLLSLIAASTLSEPTAKWCYDSFISSSVIERIEDEIPDAVDDIDLQSTIESMPDFITDRLEDIDINLEETLDNIGENEVTSHGIAEEISDRIISPIVVAALKLVFYLIIFLVVRFLLGLVSKLICKAAELPVLKQFNQTLGGVLGFCRGLFIVFALSVALNFIAQLLDQNDVLRLAIENSLICDIISDIVK